MLCGQLIHRRRRVSQYGQLIYRLLDQRHMPDIQSQFLPPRVPNASSSSRSRSRSIPAPVCATYMLCIARTRGAIGLAPHHQMRGAAQYERRPLIIRRTKQHDHIRLLYGSIARSCIAMAVISVSLAAVRLSP